MKLIFLQRTRNALLAILKRIWLLLLWHSRLLLRLALAAVLFLLVVAGAWQFWFIPRLEQYRPDLVAEFSRVSGMRVEVGAIIGSWDGIRPKLVLNNVSTFDKNNQPALSFSQLQGALSWWALPLGELSFSHLQLIAPEIKVIRQLDGRWQVAGQILEPTGGKSGFVNWLLDQGSLSVSRGRFLLEDQLLAGPRLELSQIEFHANNFFGWRRVSFGVTPPADIGQRITGDGMVSGRNIDKLDEWSGRLGAKLPVVDVAKLHQRLLAFFPKINQEVSVQAGNGKLAFTLNFSNGQIKKVDADLLLEKMTFKRDIQVFSLPLLDAAAHWESAKGRDVLSMDVRRLQGASGLLAQNRRFEYTHAGQRHEVLLRNIDLAGLSAYAALLPAPWPERLTGATLTGELTSLRWGWGAEGAQWQSDATVLGLELKAPQWLPQLGKININTSFDSQKGKATLLSRDLHFDYPQQFIEPLLLKQADATINWNRSETGWNFQAESLSLSNQEAAVNLAGSYRIDGTELGSIDIKGDIARLPAARVYAYLPREVGDDTLKWLKDSLRSGSASNGKVELRGELARFPFADGSGLFRITAAAQDVTLDYVKGWPQITGVTGEMRFEGLGMTINASRAKSVDVQLRNVVARIPDMSKSPHLLIDGKAEGGMSDFLRFVRQSPVREYTEGALDDLKSDGNGHLDLNLDIPLDDPDKTRVAGRVKLQGNKLDFGKPIPVLNQATGLVEFSESGAKINDIAARSLGGNVRASGGVDSKGQFKLALTGDAALADVAQQFSLPMANRFGGKTSFKGDLSIFKGRYDLILQSLLSGAALDLPAPLGKRALETRTFRLKLNGDAQRQAVEFAYDKWVQVALNQQGTQPYVGMVRLGVGKVAVPPSAKGVQIVGSLPELNLDVWQTLQDGNSTDSAPLITSVNLGFDRLSGWGNYLSAVRLRAVPTQQGWSVILASNQAAGRVVWRGGNQPKLTGRLDKLNLPLPGMVEVSTGTAPASAPVKLVTTKPANQEQTPKPVLDLVIDNFHYKKSDLGKLVVNATPNGDGWKLNTITLTNPDGQFSMTGLWQGSDANERTTAKFELKSENTGKLMARLGYPDALRRGPTEITGEGSWSGAPFSPKLETLQGKFRLDVDEGQFAKIEPGAGRLLSIISLQSLSRRIRFDFRDVFSDGLEFDSITGDVIIEKGIALTDNLTIKSSAAMIDFKGNANLVVSTQNIRVKIVPQVGDAAALAVVAVNPLAGAAAFALQRLLKNPLGQLASYEYEVTGDMSDPQIRKVGPGGK